MLTTNAGDEIWSECSGEETKCSVWRAVNLELWMPYAFVTYGTNEATAWHYNTTILWQEHEILDFCLSCQESSSRRIVDFSLLLPIENSATWAMRWVQVKEVWEVEHTETAHNLAVYVAADREQICSIDKLNMATHAGIKTLIYKFLERVE